MSSRASKKRKSSPSDEDAEAHSRYQSLDDERCSTIKQYLKWDCATIDLPPLRSPEGRRTPIALDGASGVGKTQQAFAFLKKKEELLVYVLLVQGSQTIYEEMEKVQKSSQMLQQINAAIIRLENKGIEKGVDDCLSEDFIKKFDEEKEVQEVKAQLVKQCMKYENDEDSGEALIFPNWYLDASVAKEHDLKNVILFLDEALPKLHNDTHIKRLRLVRNLGCVLKMQVIAAGTASTIANMIKQGDKQFEDSRRNIDKTMQWMECQLHWKTMGERDVAAVLDEGERSTKELVKANEILEDLMLRGRPLFAIEFAKEDGEDLAELLEKVGKSLLGAKNPTKGAKMVWLMGTWLEQDNLSTCPFSIKPPDLVCSHFFEPALQTLRDGSAAGDPYLSKGIAHTSNKAGPLTISIYKIALKDTETAEGEDGGAWAVCYKGGSHYSLTTSFPRISRALAPCVQQCLTREPLLAIALSYAHRITTGAEFQDTLSACLQESPAEHTLNAMSGEQMEAVVFAAIQQASLRLRGKTEIKEEKFCSLDLQNVGVGKDEGSEADKRPNLLEFCMKLIDFLEPKKLRRSIRGGVCVKWGIPQRRQNSNSPRGGKPPQQPSAVTARSHASSLQSKDTKKAKAAEESANTMKGDGTTVTKAENKVGSTGAGTPGSDQAPVASLPAPVASPAEASTEQVKKEPAEKEVTTEEDAGTNIPTTDTVEWRHAKAERLPMMVPASSAEKPQWLEEAIEKSTELEVLTNLHVAGLIPGATNVRCDIDAVNWPFMDGTPCWQFEVKARSSNYTQKMGIEDLVAKCSDHKDTTGRHHAMLIAVRGTEDTKVHMWKIQKGKKEYFRVLVLVSGFG